MQKHSLWLAYAQDDLEIAQLILASRGIRIVAVLYHAQQSAEKALKAYLIAQDASILKTHDLVKLVIACTKLDSEFETIGEHAAAFNPFSIKTRYPEDFFLMLHTSVAIQAIDHARQILEFTEIKIASIAPSCRMPKKQIRKQI